MNMQMLKISHHNKTTELQVKQMTIYLQNKIIEAVDERQQVYYLFFYKEKYLTYVKPKKLKIHSHIKQAFTKGFNIPATHPLTQHLLSLPQTYKKVTFQQLIKKAENVYSPHEVAYIATFFDSFVSKKTLFTLIQSIFYEYRRNGQMFSSYSIIRILLDFIPQHSWVKGLSSDINFIQFSKLYDQLNEQLWRKDPLYVEKALHSHIDDRKYFLQLTELLKQQSRWGDLIALYIQKINEPSYPTLLKLLTSHFSDTEVLSILEDISTRNSNLTTVHQDLLEYYLSLKKTEKVMTLLTKYQLTFTPTQSLAFEDLLRDADWDLETLSTSNIATILLPLFQIKPKKAEEVLQKCIISQLREHPIDSVVDWLSPLNNILHARPLINKIHKIKNLINDPDNQLILGELYYELKQYEQAIDCFCWEMELKSFDTKPVKWLSKIYHELGMEQEHQAYQQLYIDMQKWA